MVPPSKDLFNQFELKFLRANALTYTEYELESRKKMEVDKRAEEIEMKNKGEYQIEMQDEEIMINSFS
jgi:hypothetical protein